MIDILAKDNADDATQRDFCISELSKTESEKAAADDKMAQLASQIEEVTDSVAMSTEAITTLQNGIAALDKDFSEATAQRKEEHEDYVINSQLSETAVALVSKAKNRLQKFYNPTLYKAPPKKEMTMEEKIISAGSSALMQSEANFDAPDDSDYQGASLLQVAPPEAPQTFGEYKKSSQKSGGVVALMDMIVGELKSSNQEASMSEKYAQKEYVELMKDSQEQRAQFSKSIVEKTKAKAELEGQLTEAKENQALTLQALQK